MIEHPLADIDAWVDLYAQTELPVLRHTVVALDKMRANAENASGRMLSAVILQDPLMTLRVLAFLEKHRGKKQSTDIATIDRALMMIGVDPFFAAFAHVPLVEDTLKSHPQALLGLLKLVARARKATRWAREWAIARHDLNVEEITVACLLHEVTEILMWCFAPSLALKVNSLLAKDPKRRSADVQEEVYGVRLEDLKRSLVQRWRLPQFLAELMDHDNAEQARVLNVTLAIDLARHSAHGWSDPALPDDMRAVENLLHISHNALLARLGLDVPEPAATAARQNSAA